jgi:hypothetical protein
MFEMWTRKQDMKVCVLDIKRSRLVDQVKLLVSGVTLLKQLKASNQVK